MATLIPALSTSQFDSTGERRLAERLNEQVKRNRDRFPSDFHFQLTADEKTEVVANCDHLQNLKFSKALPFAFTEHGAIQAP